MEWGLQSWTCAEALTTLSPLFDSYVMDRTEQFPFGLEAIRISIRSPWVGRVFHDVLK